MGAAVACARQFEGCGGGRGGISEVKQYILGDVVKLAVGPHRPAGVLRGEGHADLEGTLVLYNHTFINLCK